MNSIYVTKQPLNKEMLIYYYLVMINFRNVGSQQRFNSLNIFMKHESFLEHLYNVEMCYLFFLFSLQRNKTRMRFLGRILIYGTLGMQ